MQIFTILADILTYRLLGLEPGLPFASSLHFFIEDVTKIFVLLALMIYLISFLRAGLDSNRIRDFLSGKNRFAGYALAAAFGAVTPFCSCSSIPLFLGFTSAGIPLGISMAFLITSPMINEVAVLLLGSLFGLPFMLLYVAIGLVAGIAGGAFIDLIGAERFLMPLGQKALAAAGRTAPAAAPAGAGYQAGPVGIPGKTPDAKLSMRDRHRFALDEFRSIFTRVWLWVIIGVGIGAAFHGFIPEGYLESLLAAGDWWTVPAAVLAGIPLYANASGIIPVGQSLMAKGLPAGTTIAFMMSVTAASLPEFTMLRQVMKPRLLGIFFLMLLVFFTSAGWLLNIIF